MPFAPWLKLQLLLFRRIRLSWVGSSAQASWATLEEATWGSHSLISSAIAAVWCSDICPTRSSSLNWIHSYKMTLRDSFKKTTECRWSSSCKPSGKPENDRDDPYPIPDTNAPSATFTRKTVTIQSATNIKIIKEMIWRVDLQPLLISPKCFFCWDTGSWPSWWVRHCCFISKQELEARTDLYLVFSSV